MRLLLVEDDAMIGAAAREGLRQEGHAVDWVRDGAQAEVAAANDVYDLVLLDLGLPRRDGLSVLRSLRQKGHDVPVLIITARDAVSDRVSGLDAGADDYLVKPFELDELFARIRAIIRRHAGRPHSTVVIGDVEIDTRGRKVEFCGKAAPLTACEYAILEYLALHRGEVISRTELYEHLFDENEDTLSNLLDVHVHGIRRKLRADLIVTRRGEGYLIE